MTACKRRYTLLCMLTLLKPISFRCTQNAFKTLQRSSLLQVEAMHTVGTGPFAGSVQEGMPYPWGDWKNSWLLNTRTESNCIHFQSMSLHSEDSKFYTRQLDQVT